MQFFRSNEEVLVDSKYANLFHHKEGKANEIQTTNTREKISNKGFIEARN